MRKSAGDAGTHKRPVGDAAVPAPKRATRGCSELDVCNDFFALLPDETLVAVATCLTLQERMTLARCSRRWTCVVGDRALLTQDVLGDNTLVSPHYRDLQTVGHRLSVWRVLHTAGRLHVPADSLTTVNYDSLTTRLMDVRNGALPTCAPAEVFTTVSVDGAARRVTLGLADLEHLTLLLGDECANPRVALVKVVPVNGRDARRAAFCAYTSSLAAVPVRALSVHAYLLRLASLCSLRLAERLALMALCVYYDAFRPLCVLLERVQADMPATWYWGRCTRTGMYAPMVLQALVVSTGERASKLARADAKRVAKQRPWAGWGAVRLAVQRTYAYQASLTLAQQQHSAWRLEAARAGAVQHGFAGALGM